MTDRVHLQLADGGAFIFDKPAPQAGEPEFGWVYPHEGVLVIMETSPSSNPFCIRYFPLTSISWWKLERNVTP
jgi:hypothetical protein